MPRATFGVTASFFCDAVPGLLDANPIAINVAAAAASVLVYVMSEDSYTSKS
jgi:hypothetical protein